MGMRVSGSNSVELNDVFISTEGIAACRPRGDFHAVYCVVLSVALPLIMSVYMDAAEQAAALANERCADNKDPVTPYLLDEMATTLTTALVMTDHMVRLVDDLRFEADIATVSKLIKRKTVVVQACSLTCNKAAEATGRSRLHARRRH